MSGNLQLRDSREGGWEVGDQPTRCRGGADTDPACALLTPTRKCLQAAEIAVQAAPNTGWARLEVRRLASGVSRQRRGRDVR